MTFLGIDLAWNSRARTGLATLDDDGALTAVASVVTDAEIDSWIREQPSARLIAVDAPLIVPNIAGSRGCEKQIGAAFGRFDAGAYPANRGNPLFDPPRALTLARRHGWLVDPDTTERPLALEVYPHPAMVGLFHLDRILPYKARPHRSLAHRRDAFVRLCDHLESIPTLRAAQHAGYAALRRAVTDATRPGLLGPVEDQLDAIVCAHLAWLWEHRREALRVYGDAREGFIVAPPPPTWPPAPRVRRPRTRSGQSAPAPPPVPSAEWEIAGHPRCPGTDPGSEVLAAAWARAVREARRPPMAAPGSSWHIDLDFRLEPHPPDDPELALDGLVSSTLDALLGGADDTSGPTDGLARHDSVTRITATKREAREGEQPGARIRLGPV